MVWFSCTLTFEIVPSVPGCERSGPGTAHPGPHAHAHYAAARHRTSSTWLG
jgi:hypothetical protein